MNNFLKPFTRTSVAVLILFQIQSCKTGPGSDKNYPGSENAIYELRLSPVAGSAYHYDITNESDYKIEVEDKKVENINRSNVGISYSIDKDSIGNFLFKVGYDKVQLYSKSGGTETDKDADNAANSADPAEKMLGLLKQVKFTTVMSPKGDVRSSTGYDDLKSKVMTTFGPTDNASKKIVETQWDKQIRDGLLKKNMDQFFKIFPDSAVHVGDEWVINSSQQDQINMHVQTRYTLERIKDGNAVIKLDGILVSDSTVNNMSGYSFIADLKGKQEGELEISARTGMLVSTDITGDIKGTMTIMARTIPVTMHMSVKARGTKIK